MSSGFSKRTAVDRTENALGQAIRRRRALGLPLLDLTVSNPTQVGLPYPHQAIATCLAEAEVRTYDPQPLGIWEARVALANRIGADPEATVLCASTSEAYGLLLKLCADPGEAVLVPEPSYPLFEHLLRFEGLELRPYPLRYDGEWHLDSGTLRSAAHGARAVVVVHPNHPTGSYLRLDEARVLAELGLPVISDEVFGRYALSEGAGRAGPLHRMEGIEAFSLGGLSKWAGLPQLKLAWIVVGGPREWREEALGRLELLNDTWLGAGTQVQRALPRLLEVAEPVAAAILARVRENLQALDRTLAEAPSVTRLPVEGGWSAVLRVPSVDEADLVRDLAVQEGVVVHPGHFYDFPHEGYVVVSLLVEPEVLAAGIRHLLARIERSY
jgi:aspartate/methionine/tyrosine aminotransferase